MEIRNNTAINKQSFGMALRRPSAEHMKRFVEALNLNTDDIGAKIRKAGLKQLEKQTPGAERFDVVYTVNDAGVDTYQVVDNKFNKVVSEYINGQEGLVKRPACNSEFIQLKNKGCENVKDLFKFLGSLLKVLANVTVNPKDSLPRALLTAAKDADDLNKTAIAQNKARTLSNKAINDVNKIFDK